MNHPETADFPAVGLTTLGDAIRVLPYAAVARTLGPIATLRHRRRAARLARQIAYGGGVTGLAGLAGYSVLWSEAKLARRWITPPAASGPHASGRYGAGAATGRPLRLAILGDSSGVGLGCQRPAETPGALLAAAISESGPGVELDVLAVVGTQSADLDVQVTRALLHPPQVAVVMIGANDVTHLVSPESAATDLYRAVVRLRADNVRVVVGTCPDLAAVRPIAQPLRWVAGSRSRAIAQAQEIAVAAAGGVAVPLGRLLVGEFTRDPTYFCADRYHPSARGYAALMAAMLPAVRAEADRALVPPTRPNEVRPGSSTVAV
jgi:lysophospholipase L1-like esterase